MGRKMEWDGRVIEWTENYSIVWEAISGTPQAMRMKAMNRVEMEGDGARYSLDLEYVTPYSIFKMAQHSTQNLKRIIEQH